MRLEVVFDNSDRVVLVPEQAPPAVPRWLVPHDRMRYDYDARLSGGWRFNPAVNGRARAAARENNMSLPEVYWFYPEHGTKLTDSHISLLEGINDFLDPEKTRTLLDTGLAWCNGSFAVFDKPRFCGGAVVTGAPGYSLLQGLVDGARLVIDIAARRHSFLGAKLAFKRVMAASNNILNIKTLLLSDPVPSAEEFLKLDYLWYWAVGVQPDSDINYFLRRGKDGLMHHVRMFIITRLPIYSRLDELYTLPDNFIPDSQWMPAPYSLI
jgi:hypothetical protein